ncbi:MAG: phytanoyl-CoA dioxygenase [Phenylobacterium sp.]|nr:phytanoyl-CoA dioxygenase [Phenylobacterium sp.]
MTAAADLDWPALREAFARDGVVKLPAALDPARLAQARAAYDWSLAHPGPGASKVRQATEATFYNDLFNPEALAGYRAMLEASPIPAHMAKLWDASDVWFFYEQVFLKEGGEARRTPWHQDSSYLAIAGDHLAVVWISFDAVAQADSLEFVRGSHRGALYNGSSFKLGDDTAPLHPDSSLPRLPDIEAQRAAWDIVAWAVQPGDLIVFHPAVLHGGAATHAGTRRRTLTLRFFGERAVYDPREGGAGPPIRGFHQRMRAGDPFRDPSFLKLR